MHEEFYVKQNKVEETQSLSGQQGAGAVQQQRDVPPLFHESSLGFNDMLMVCLSLVSSVHCRVTCGDLSRLSCYLAS